MEDDAFVRITLTDSFGLREMMALADSAPSDDKRPILVDASALSKAGPVEHALMGEHVARVMPDRKVAVVIGESAVSYNSERAARRAGMDLRVFTSEQEALAWLERKAGTQRHP